MKSDIEIAQEAKLKPIAEIAGALGISQPSVSYRLKRGREKLRKLLEGRDQDA